HPFSNADAAVNLTNAGYGEPIILEMTKADQLDILSGDAVMLRLLGLSDSAVDVILHKRMKGQRTLASAEIGRLKNTGLTEGQIMERINRGMTDAEADKEAAYREATRNHANTGFTRVHGRKPGVGMIPRGFSVRCVFVRFGVRLAPVHALHHLTFGSSFVFLLPDF